MGLIRQRITYAIGSLNNPSDALGRDRLVIETDGRARLDKLTRGGRFAWTGTIETDALDSLWLWLDLSGFPKFPMVNMPPGGAMHELSIGRGPASARSAFMYIHMSPMPHGYGQAFSIIDRIIREMSEAPSANASAATPRTVGNVTPVTQEDPCDELSPGAAFLLACDSWRGDTVSARAELLARHGMADDPALARAIAHSRASLDGERAAAYPPARIEYVAGHYGVTVPALRSAAETTAWLTAIAAAVRPLLTTPVLEAAWRAGEAARLVAVRAGLVVTVTKLREAAPDNADLRALACDLGRDLTDNATTLKAHLEATALPDMKIEAERVERLIRAASSNDPAREIDAVFRETARLLDLTPDDDLQRALQDGEYRESLVRGPWGPLAAFLAAAGAYSEPLYRDTDYTDGNGAMVGRGPGSELIRSAIPPDPNLPFEELERLIHLGPSARALVARHPSTPTQVLLMLAGQGHHEVQKAIRERPTNDPAVLYRLRAVEEAQAAASAKAAAKAAEER